MGISLITPGAAAISSSLIPVQEASGDSIGFANLLSLQLLDLSNAQTTVNAPKDEKKETDEDISVAATEDAIALLPGLLPPTIPVAPDRTSIAIPTAETTDNSAESRTVSVSKQVIGEFQPTIEHRTSNDNLIPQVQPQFATTGLAIPQTTEQLSGIGKQTENDTANLAATSNGELARNDFLNTLNAKIAHTGTPPTGVVHTDNVPTPLNDARWAQDFSEKVVWMARNEQQSAQININPPQLGPLQISLSLNGDQASATFSSPHAEVRQAIEDAMPRLREMLAGAGIDLGQANVGAQLAQQQTGKQSSNPDAPRFGDDTAILSSDSKPVANTTTHALHSGRGLVDLFA